MVALAGPVILGGCARTQTADDAFDGVQTLVNERADAQIVWNRNSDDDRAVVERISALLSQELSVEQAVQVALLNNRRLQATYEQIGVSQADLVQAGLLQNPVFSISTRFPDGGGGTDLELGITQQFISLLSIPLKQRLAEAELERTQIEVAAAVLDLSAEVEHQVYHVQAAQQLLEMHRTIAESAGASATVAQELRNAGNTTELELARRRAMQEEAQLDSVDAQTQWVIERERLGVLMGISSSPTNWTVAPRLAELPEADIPLGPLESIAALQRLELLAAQQNMEVAARRIKLVKPFAAFPEAEIGIDSEHESDGQWLTGPNVAFPIPLFDQGQASISRGEAEFRQARNEFLAARTEIASEVRSAHAQMESARTRAGRYRTSILPLRQSIVEHTQLQYNAMQVGVYDLIQAQRDQIAAGTRYVEALRDYWAAKADLKHAVGGRLPAPVPSTQPTNAPAVPEHPTEVSPHSHHHSEAHP